MDMKTSGMFIAACRREKGLTQQQLGELLGVTNRAVSKWENGRSFPDVGLLESLCDTLEISVSELLAGEKIPKEEYPLQTDRLLIDALGLKRLYGMQLTLRILTIIAVLLFDVPFLAAGDRFLPSWNAVTGICWGSCLVLAIDLEYLDRSLPARKLRYSNPWLEGLWAGLFFLILMAVNLLRDNVYSFFLASSLSERLLVAGFFVLCFVLCIAAGVFFARLRRKDLNKEE